MRKSTFNFLAICTVCKYVLGYIPKSSSRVMDGSSKSSSSLGCQIGSQRWNGFVVIAWIIGEFNSDWFGGAFGYGSV